MWFCGPPEKDSNKNKFDGAYPSGFMKNVKQGFHKYYPKNTDDILHVCAGRIPASEGIRLDVDECYDPDYVGNCEIMTVQYPELINRFSWVQADPPYNKQASEKYYNKPMLNKGLLLKQMSLCVKIGGIVAMLDQDIITNAPRNLKRMAIIGVTVNPNKQIRAFNVYQRVS